MEIRNLDDIFVVNKKGKMYSLTDIPYQERKEFIMEIDNVETLQYMVLKLSQCLRTCADTLDIKAEFKDGISKFGFKEEK